MSKFVSILSGLSLLVSPILQAQDAQEKKPYDSAKWEKAIRAFEKADAKKAPDPGGTLFLGSSSIRMWDTEKWFPGQSVTNRGFGGSRMIDAITFAKRIALPYKPKTIVLYEGDNDIGGGLTAKEVVSQFNEFVALIHKDLPDTRIIFIAIKPSLKRWNLWPVMKDANDQIAAICGKNQHLDFADIASVGLGADGKPRPEIFAKDGLHLNEKGYEVWTGVINRLFELSGSANGAK